MSTAASPAEAKKKCSYQFPDWHCPFDAEDGLHLCIFHLPTDKKKPEDFWRHMASYLRALYESAGNEATDRFLSEKRAEIWFLRESDAHLTGGYKTRIAKALPWRFTGFIFPATDGPHNFAGFVFPATNFRDATFSGKADFRDATFGGEAGFVRATFSGEAYFRDATFSGEAGFWNARFSGDADFSFVQFVQPPSFARAEFKSRVDFYEAKLPGLSWQDDERTARDIRLLAERFGSYADAGDSYMIEMDFRRKRFRRTPGRWFQYLLMELYRFSSRYGESPGRAVVSFLAVLAGFGVLYSLAGFSIGSMDVGRGLSLDLRQISGTLLDFVRGMWLSLINLLPGNLRGETLGVKLPTTLGKLAAVFQVVFSYATLTLFLLAIRRRFRR